MKHILSIAYSQDHANFDEIIEFQGEQLRLTQYSTSFNFELSKNIIQKYDGQVDVISISGVPPAIKYKGGVFIHPKVEKLKMIAKETPIVDGQLTKNVYIPWAIRKFHFKHPHILSRKNIGFYSGSIQKPLLEVLSELDNNIVLADPYFFLKLPFCLKGKGQLEKFIKFTSPLFKNMDIKRSHVADFSISNNELSHKLDNLFASDLFVGNETTFKLVDLEHLKGKTVVVDFLGPELEKKFSRAGVKDVVVCMPKVIDNPYVNFSILEAIFQIYKEEKQPLIEDDILDWIGKLNLASQKKDFSENISTNYQKFAFIIHPLGTSHLFKHPLLRFLKGYSKPIEPIVEELLALAPGFFYGNIEGIVSEKNGKEVEGLIYTVTETPKKLMEKDASTIYKKLVGLCRNASDKGAGIIGLGAYTKIVGDAGVTVASQSPIPVTTGNSLSACATLWAAKFALDKMNFVKKKNGNYNGKVMVVGATGSIGAVSAKILAQEWDELVLVAPRAYKLLELKEEILEIAPNCNVQISTTSESHCSTSDLIITTTSSRGKKILNILDVKPGGIICDVSRPFDIKEEDALLRPDVMVIASGEVQLPGDIKMNVDIGLEGNIVYACLAETALLAMEGKLESFTLSRNISYEKVLEIDRMAGEHGVRLSSIMGHSGFITDEEFELCRLHAIKNRKSVQGEVNGP